MKIKTAEIKVCLSCGKVLKGRSDKLFCDLGCKNDYHNKDSNDGEQVQKRILKILRTNRKILKEMLGEKTSLDSTLTLLKAKGFQTQHLTHFQYQVGNSGKIYYFSFDYGFRDDDDGNVKIVKAFKF